MIKFFIQLLGLDREISYELDTTLYKELHSASYGQQT